MGVSSHTHSTAASRSGSPSDDEETGKLKSVVAVVLPESTESREGELKVKVIAQAGEKGALAIEKMDTVGGASGGMEGKSVNRDS